jgi:hypothetical protein
VKVTQYDQHRVRCRCGRVHTALARKVPGQGSSAAARNRPSRSNLMVGHLIPVSRWVVLREGAGRSLDV